MATAAAAPRRSRALQIDTPVKAIPGGAAVQGAATPAMVSLAQAVIIANGVKNKSTSDEKKAKEALNKLMIAGDVKKFTFTVEVAGAFQSCEATIETSIGEYIDVKLLRGLVDDATFMKIVSATKGDTKELAGENIVIKTTRTVTKPEALFVKKIKE